MDGASLQAGWWHLESSAAPCPGGIPQGLGSELLDLSVGDKDIGINHPWRGEGDTKITRGGKVWCHLDILGPP